MEHNDFDDIDRGAVGGEDAAGEHSQMSARWLDLYLIQCMMDLLELEKMNVCMRVHEPRLETGISQEHAHLNRDTHIHPPGADHQRPEEWDPDPEWEPDPHNVDSPCEAETISIADCKTIVPSRDCNGQARTPNIEPEQEQRGSPSVDNNSHAIAPSGSWKLFDYLTFWPVLTSFYYSSESRPVFTEISNSDATGDAYCFGNSFVSMSVLPGSSAVPILCDSQLMSTESFENTVVSRDDYYQDNDNGCDDDNVDGVTMPFKM